MLSIADIAKICHTANKALCEIDGDTSQKEWENAEEWQKISAIDGVVYVINNPDISDSTLHDIWMQNKLKDGWVYGKEKDINKKIHNCLVPFEELPPIQQAEDTLLIAICKALSSIR